MNIQDFIAPILGIGFFSTFILLIRAITEMAQAFDSIEKFIKDNTTTIKELPHYKEMVKEIDEALDVIASLMEKFQQKKLASKLRNAFKQLNGG